MSEFHHHLLVLSSYEEADVTSFLDAFCQAAESNQFSPRPKHFPPSSFLSSQGLPHHFLTSPSLIPAMAHTPMPSALTFELIARCSVGFLCLLVRIMLIITDHQSSSSQPHTSPWPSPITSVYASRDAGLFEGIDATTARSNRVSTLSQQYISSGSEARTRGARKGWRSA